MKCNASRCVLRLKDGFHLVLVKDGCACAVPMTKEEADKTIKEVLGAVE